MLKKLKKSLRLTILWQKTNCLLQNMQKFKVTKDLGSAASTNNEIQCSQLTDYKGQDLKQNLNKELSNAKCFGTDEKIVYLSHFDPAPAGSNKVAVKT